MPLAHLAPVDAPGAGLRLPSSGALCRSSCESSRVETCAADDMKLTGWESPRSAPQPNSAVFGPATPCALKRGYPCTVRAGVGGSPVDPSPMCFEGAVLFYRCSNLNDVPD